MGLDSQVTVFLISSRLSLWAIILQNEISKGLGYSERGCFGVT